MEIPVEFFARASRWYRGTAVIVLNTLILLSTYVFFSYMYYAVRRPRSRPVYSVYLRPRAMHRMSADEAIRFFKEFDRMGENETYIYQPWVGFSERVFHSTRLNVDEAAPTPARRTIPNGSDRGGRPLVIWVFGGSTTFGWGVPDDETIPSHLSATLSRDLPSRKVAVTNHGHSFYFSSQELALFQMLLRPGDHCDAAVFLDGLNESFRLQDAPAFTDRMAVAFAKEQERNPTLQAYFWLSPDFPPLRLLPRLGRPANRKPVSPPAELSMPDLVSRYEFNLSAEAALGRMHGTKTLFFWQPVPDSPPYASARELAVRVHQAVEADNFHFIADVFKGMDPRDVYVDDHHYGDTASERIAGVIAREVLATVDN